MDLQGFGWQLGVGLQMTLQVAVVSVMVGLVLGMIGATAKLSASVVARKIADGYTTFVRGVPELILLLILFFGGTMLVQRLAEALGSEDYIEIDAFTAGVLTLVSSSAPMPRRSSGARSRPYPKARSKPPAPSA